MPKDKHKSNWVSRLKERVQRELKSRHSPAGKKYIEYKKAVKRFAGDIKKDNPNLSSRQAVEIAEDELSGAHEKRMKRKERVRRRSRSIA